MNESTLQTEASQVIERYFSDETMLDALLQWASNPTSMSAGYGLEENYPYVAKNLAARYRISRLEAEKRVAELRSVCNSLVARVEKMPHIEPRRRIGEIQGALFAALQEDAPERVLRQGVLKRLREVSDETRRALLVFMLLEKEGLTLITADSLRRPADRYSDYQSEFQAYYKSIFSDTIPVLRVVDELVRCGAYSELYWVPSPTAKSSPQSTLVEAVIPTVEEIERAGTHLPSPPDIPALLESQWHHGEFDLLRTIDVVGHSYGGIWRPDEPLPVKASSPGFMGVYGQRIALAPVIAAATRQQIEIMKSEKMEDSRLRVEAALVAVARRLGRDATLGVLWTGMGEVLWKFELTASPAFYVYLAPWLTTFAPSPGLSRISPSERPHVLFVIPYQSRPSILGCLERTSGFSLKDTRQEKSLGLLSDPLKPQEFLLLVGQRHPLLNGLLAELNGEPKEDKAAPRSLEVGLDVAPEVVAVGTKVVAKVQVRDGQKSSVAGAEVGLSWGDGTPDSSGPSDDQGVQSATHLYGKVGTYTISVTASKGEGSLGKAQQQVVVSQKKGNGKLIDAVLQRSVIRVGSIQDHGQHGLLGRIDGQDVLLDLYEPHAVTVLGVQGSGKSYAAGAIIEMAVRSIQGISTLQRPLSCTIFHFSKEENRIPEWIGLASKNTSSSQTEKLQSDYHAVPESVPSDHINVLVPPTKLSDRVQQYPGFNVMPLAFSPSKLKADDWRRLLTFGKGSDALYMDALNELMIALRDKKEHFGVDDLKDEIGGSDLTPNQKRFALLRLKMIGRWLSQESRPFADLLKPGFVNIVDLRDPLAVNAQMASLLLQTVFSFVKDRTSEGICLVAIDEAHLFFEHEQLTKEIVEFVAQLRKDYKVYLLLMSQQPGRFHPDILALSDVMICYRLESDSELEFLKKSKPSFGDVAKDIKKLKTGEGKAFIWARVSTDDVLERPNLLTVRPKCTEDRGKTATAF